MTAIRRLARAVRYLLAGLIAATCLSAGATAQDGSVAAPLAPSSLLLDIARAGDRLVAVGERGHILLSDDSGVTWRQVSVPTRATLTAISFVDPDTGWAVGHDAVVLRTADGGESWELQYDDPDYETPLMDVLFADTQSGFAVGAYGLFLETTDGGDTWGQRWVTEDDFHFNAILNPAPGHWFMAGEAGGLYRSDDDGQNWQVLESPYLGSFFGAMALGRDDLLVFGLQGNMFRSSDGGDSWRRIETGTTAALVSGTKLSNGRIVIVGLSGAMLVSDDDGGSVRLSRRSDRTALAGVAEAPDDDVLVLVGETGVARVPPDLVAALSPAEAAR